MANERELIAAYLDEQWHHLQEVKGTWLMLGVRWAIARILDKPVREDASDPEPTESLESFLRRHSSISERLNQAEQETWGILKRTALTVPSAIKAIAWAIFYLATVLRHKL